MLPDAARAPGGVKPMRSQRARVGAGAGGRLARGQARAVVWRAIMPRSGAEGVALLQNFRAEWCEAPCGGVGGAVVCACRSRRASGRWRKLCSAWPANGRRKRWRIFARDLTRLHLPCNVWPCVRVRDCLFCRLVLAGASAWLRRGAGFDATCSLALCVFTSGGALAGIVGAVCGLFCGVGRLFSCQKAAAFAGFALVRRAFSSVSGLFGPAGARQTLRDSTFRRALRRGMRCGLAGAVRRSFAACVA